MCTFGFRTDAAAAVNSSFLVYNQASNQKHCMICFTESGTFSAHSTEQMLRYRAVNSRSAPTSVFHLRMNLTSAPASPPEGRATRLTLHVCKRESLKLLLFVHLEEQTERFINHWGTSVALKKWTSEDRLQRCLQLRGKGGNVGRAGQEGSAYWIWAVHMARSKIRTIFQGWLQAKAPPSATRRPSEQLLSPASSSHLDQSPTICAASVCTECSTPFLKSVTRCGKIITHHLVKADLRN